MLSRHRLISPPGAGALIPRWGLGFRPPPRGVTPGTSTPAASPFPPASPPPGGVHLPFAQGSAVAARCPTARRESPWRCASECAGAEAARQAGPPRDRRAAWTLTRARTITTERPRVSGHNRDGYERIVRVSIQDRTRRERDELFRVNNANRFLNPRALWTAKLSDLAGIGTCRAVPRFDYPALLRRARDAWAKAELAPVGLHAARHTAASLMIAANVNMKALSEFMGHASITITLDRYGHLLPGSLSEAATLLDSYLARTGAQTGAREEKSLLRADS